MRKAVFIFICVFLTASLLQSSDTNLLTAGFLVIDKVYNSELMAPYDVFHHTVFHVKPGIHVITIAATKGRINTFEGLRIDPDYTIQNAPAIDILVIPSAEHNMDFDLQNQELKNWVRKTAESARYVVTLCDGAFILANTGLLDGKKATTFPSDIQKFRKLFPKIDTQENYSFVHDGKYLTSQGGAKSYDVAMYLVDLLYGEKVAAGVGEGLIIPWKNPNLVFLKASK
jgi:transcriptional regulator GlxA family with amidase domain